MVLKIVKLSDEIIPDNISQFKDRAIFTGLFQTLLGSYGTPEANAHSASHSYL
jgi:hypothetical protein